MNVIKKKCDKCGKEFAGFTEEQVEQYIKVHQMSKYCKNERNK